MQLVFPLVLLLPFLLSTADGQTPDGQVYGFVSFSTERVEVHEDSGNTVTTVQLPLIREVGSTGTILATVEVTNASVESDFFSSSAVVSFTSGVTTASAVLLLQNDDEPEGNETFIVNITGTRFGAEVGSVNSLVLFVRGSDEPYGDFQFSTGSRLVNVSEATSGGSVELTVERSPGIFGRVTVDYQITSGPNNGIDDLSPTGGQLVFNDGIASVTLTISVTPDNIPENDESFTITLSNPRGGAGLAESHTEAVITIAGNDTPLRFGQTQYTVAEDAGSVVLTITRGVLDDGTEIGDLSGETTVDYETVAGTATAGTDFNTRSGTITFAPGATSQNISIPIVDDSNPEGDELFSVSLSKPSSDSVLSTPSSAMVLIEVNDNAGGFVQFASAGPVVVGEDDGATAEFTIQRLNGSYSDVTLEWRVVDSNENLVSDDFQTTRGNITILDGETEVVLEIQPTNDDVSEIAEMFSVELIGVISRTGELQPMGTRVATLIVEDSDDVYGLVELAADTQLHVTSDASRQLHLAVTRSPGTTGTISVDYYVTYLHEGVSSASDGDSSVVAEAAGSVRLVGGDSSVEWDVEILSEAFLDTSGQFYVKLSSTALVEGVVPLVTPTNSPRIGPRSEAYISIPESAANGYISFAQSTVTTLEPEDGSGGFLSLALRRSGAYGTATVTWMVVSITTNSSDLGTSSGMTAIENGATETSVTNQIVVVILNDDEPEIDEMFEVQLVSVAESGQRINPEQNTSVVTIALNDNARGVFTVSSAQSPYTIEESSDDVISITVHRGEGALTSETIQYQILPGFGADFIGSVGVAQFPPGVTEAEVFILPNDDNIPEDTEEFNFTITPSSSDLLGDATYIGITILANDEYAGVFSFADSSLQITIDEPGLEGSSSVATLTVERGRGSFTDVTVYWEVTDSSAESDISPTSGSVNFTEGQTTATFTISALEDEIPEDDLHYTVALTEVSGDGQLASSSTQTSLTVGHNDDPINLRNSTVDAREGETVELVVTRAGHANGIAEVSFEVAYTSASSDDVTITPSSSIVTFEDGEYEAVISVLVVNDTAPEETERLEISLTSTTGDAVLVTPTAAVFNILPNDDPNGVFVFGEDFTDLSVEEGESLEITVERLQGSFGNVEIRVNSYLLDATTGDRTATSTSTDLEPTTLLLTFTEGETSETFTLQITDEDTPEFEETFELVLTVMSSTGDSEDGARLGTASASTIRVSENDDPHGLFVISPATTSVEVAEDVGEGEDGGSVEVVVERENGVVGRVQVAWELVPELDSLLPDFTDLLFLGSRGSSISEVTPRSNTGTIALVFSGDSDSIVMLPSEDNPPIITNQLTISLWILVTGGTAGGVLVAKTTEGGSATFYALEMLPSGEDFLIRFSYLPASQTSGSESVEVSVVQSSLADGDWHSLTVVVEGSVATFYLDASRINSRTLEESSIRDGTGEVTVGGITGSGDSYFTGSLQDVRIYTASLDQSQISAIGTDATAATLTPISGYLTFEDGDTEYGITVSTVDDLIPKPSTVFRLQLTNSNGGSRIDSTANSATVTVLKSDAANGVFGFDSLSLSNTIEETSSVSLAIQRLQGDYGSVTVHWEIREVGSNAVATSDFKTPSGTLEFSEGDRQQVLVVEPTDEVEPELNEMFVVYLTDALSNDGYRSSTPTSGASINSSLDQSNLTVTENDYPYGLLQFSTAVPPPSGLILAAESMPQISTRESAGTVTLYIVRAQGTLGTVGVEYLTVDGTATGTGGSPDYLPTAGSVMFGPSDRYTTLELSLVDDDIPERERVFYVSLTNPTGDEGVPELSIGRNITVAILPSDDAFGVFLFAAGSLSRLVSEQNGGTPITLTVERLRGTFDNVSVYWEVEGGGGGDISPTSSSLDFPEGVTEGELTVTINNDETPELEEELSIRLVNASGGATVATSGSQVATITVQASDHPYGLFTFSSAFRPLVVVEDGGQVEVMVTREFGDLGRVTVSYATVESGHNSLQGLVDVTQLEQNSQLAVAGDDYIAVSGSLIFEEGELTKSFTLSISSDSVPELDEYIFIAIVSVELDPDSVEDVDNSVLPTSASGNGSLAFVVIAENDDARGVLQLFSSTYEAEESSQNIVTVSRGAGSFGTVTVDWEAVPLTAQSSDFIPSSGTVVLDDGVSSIQLPLSIIDDTEPEFSETLSVTLVGSRGGASLGAVLTATVTILASDDPNGALQFAVGSTAVSVPEPESGASASVTLVVERTGGDTGVVEVSWTLTSSNGDDPSLDIVPVSGTLQYVSGVRQQSITLSINTDDIPEIAEEFTVSLSGATGGARVGDSPTATVTIEANDSPNGFVSFESPTMVATEDDVNSVIMVSVVRSAGLFRNISVIYSTAPSSPPSATGGNDYTSIIGAEVIIGEGFSNVNIPITILADDLPELNENFQLSLVSVYFTEEVSEDMGDGGPQLGEITSSEITIRENDDPYGRFRITEGSGESEVRVPEADSLGVSLIVTREAGSVGTVEVTWSVSGTAEENVDFAGSGALLTFDEETTQRTVSLIIFEDTLPERDEYITVTLSNPTGGAVLASDGGSAATVVIEANDNAAGIVGLVESSRSAIVAEGETVTLGLERSVGSLGVVEVSWEISGPGDQSTEFVPSSGTANFTDGSNYTEIVFSVAADGTPELAEEYSLSLTSVQTLSDDISSMGRAELDPSATMATITLRASDNPHGVVEFQEMTAETEESSSLLLTVVREFGAIGAVDVVYQAVMGNIGALADNTTLATPDLDFNTSQRTIRLEDGQLSTTVLVPIINETDPELSEVFLVQLISVTLDPSEDGDVPPSIGTNDQVQVTILPNDNPEGILNFELSSVTVSEDVSELELIVRRDQGTVGRVSAVVLLINRGATLGMDYIRNNHERIVLQSGDSEGVVLVTIVDDALPELGESFCISLILPEGNVEIGDTPEVCVTIDINDNAYGQFSFDSGSVDVSIDEAGEIITAANVAELRVVRSGGVNGIVSIPFELEQNGNDDLSLSPTTGLLVFAEGQDFGIIEVTAVEDDIPELSETYTVSLLDPYNIGDLSDVNLTASVTIRPNQNPHGLLEIYFTDSTSSELAVEEDVGYIELEIRRADGTFGEISVDLHTVAGSAVSPTGDCLSLSVTQLLDTTGARKWYQFSRSGTHYLFLTSSSPTGNSVLYEWRGAFVPVQNLSTYGASAATFLSVEGRDFLVVSNYGTEGNREINSTVYQFSDSGQLEEVQTIATEGASDVISLVAPNGVQYVVIANREDNDGSPNTDSLVLQWSQGRFVLFQSLATIGASAVDVVSVGSTQFLVFSSFTDTRSPVYVWRDGGFRLDHHIDTLEATDVESVDISGAVWLAVATGSSGVSLFQWSADDSIFVFNSTLSSDNAFRVESIPETDYLLVTNSDGPGQLFSLSNFVQQELNVPVGVHHYPFSLDSETVYVASALSASDVEQSSIGVLQNVDTTADFYPRSVTLTFAPGQTYHYLVTEIIDDSTPELDEEFSISLSQPTGGAVLGTHNSLTVTILTNDDAYGLVGFSEGSLSVLVPETEASSEVALTVVRERGAFGEVRVSWQVMGEHSHGEISPTSGEVVFAEGDSEATITLTVHPDLLPELNEVTVVELTEITQNGVPPGSDAARGAGFITSRTQSVVTVEANDAPHGVLVWAATRIQVEEVDGANSVVQLTILREFGSIGALLISYSTFVDTSVPTEDQAIAGMDFLPIAGNVTMADNVTSATVPVTILHDNEPELFETFLVSLTNVILINNEDREGTTSNSPRVDADRSTVILEIGENDNSRGLLQFLLSQLTVDEDIGSIQLEVERGDGVFGRVSADFNLTGITANADDFSPELGSVEFEMAVSSRNITVYIINDSEPEFDESFVISLVNPQDGAAIGDMNSVVVTIRGNDDINGAFSFNSVLILLAESESPDDPNGVATLTVLRSRSTDGEVTVYWEVGQDGVSDLQPTSGNLTFRDGESEQSFQVRAVSDGIPELFESFLVELVGTEGGGRIADPSEARIAIQASDNPNGVVGFDSYPSGIVINEGDLLTFRILRSAGLFGEVTATWRITPSDTTVFTTTSTTVIFADGQSEATVTVQTISDDIPETARLFSLEIESTGLAVVNETLSQVDIVVRASDYPHGVVEFAQPSAVTTRETGLTLSLPVERHNGLVGDLMLNFYILQSSTATSPEDYVFLNQSIIIPANTGSSELLVTIIDDSLPELAETVSLSLLSVALTQDIDGGRDFNFSGDPASIDQSPRLGTLTLYTLTIAENDDPYGVVSLTESTLLVSEGDTALLTVQRTGGSFGLVILSVSVTSGSANAAADFTDVTGSLVRLSQDETTATITIPIIQDGDPELQEDFRVSISLSPSSSPAVLGSITSATVIIDASDSPHGEVGFEGSLVYNIDNPESSPVSFPLPVERDFGHIGQTEVVWEVVGPYPGQEQSDISPTGGTLTLQDGQSGGSIMLDILPSTEVEEEKTFTVYLLSASNDVVIDQARGSVTITVAQRGMPYGTIGFFGDVLQLHKVDEGVGSQSVTFPIARTAPALGDVHVSFAVTGVSDPSLDVHPSSGTLLLASGLSQVDLSLEILDDSDPELEETFTLILSQPTGGATLDPLAATSTFIIRANDAPYGRFSITQPSIIVDQSNFPEISRTFAYTIVRQSGLIGDVLLNVLTTYTPDPTAEYVEEFSAIIEDGRLELAVDLPVSPSACITPGSVFTISITDASLQGLEAQEGSGPEVADPAELVVTDSVGNALIGFNSSSLAATINEESSEGNNVALTVVRRGELGTVMVYWSTGLPGSSLSNGSISPQMGSFQMTSSDTSSQILLTATPRSPHGVPEVFAVWLAVEPVVSLSLPAKVSPTAGTSLLEPSGVVQLAGSAFSGVESSGNIQVTVQRYYGSMGNIQVFGMAAVAPNSSVPDNQEAALESTDFAAILVTVTIPDGSTSGVLSVPVFDNQESGPLKVFQFTLTSVAGGVAESSPRLSRIGQLSALLTIIDDEAGAGLFRLEPTSDTVEEEAGRFSFSVSREGGNQGRVAVMVQTVEGDTQDDGSVSATEGVDYTGLPPQEVVFEDGDSVDKIFSISLSDDIEPEIDEVFTVVLSNPPGGSALIDPNADRAVVTIAASDSPGGVFSLSPTAITLSEETASTGTLTVTRTGGTLTQVEINWVALYTDGQIHDTAINSILGLDRATLTFPIGVTSVDIILTLQPNSVPVSGEVFTLRIQSDDGGIELGPDTEATVTVQAKQSSLFQITATDIKKVVTESGGVTVGVERVNGTQLTAIVQYATVELSGNMTVGQLTLQPAQFGIHYTATTGSLTFTTSAISAEISLNVIDPQVAYPRAFNVVISTSEPHNVRNSQATLVLSPPGPLSRLIDIYFNTLESTTTAHLESVTNSLYMLLSEGVLVGSLVQFVSGEDQLQFEVTQYILREVTTKASGRYTSSLTGNMSDIFQLILDDATFSGRSEFVETMKQFAYSLLDGEPCSIDAPVSKTLSRLLFHLVAERLPPASLAQRRFTASFSSDNDDFVKFPTNSIFPGSSLAGIECVDVHYIELVEERILRESTLDSKVLSIGIRGQSSQTQSPVTYRIYTDTRVMPLENDCLLWNRTFKTWDDKTCKTIRSGILPTRNSYVECQCHQLGEFAVVEDVERGYGWTLSAGLVAAFVAVVTMMVIGVHMRYFRRTQLVTRIFVMLCVSVLLYQVMLLVSVFASDQPDTTESGCTTIAIFLHFTAILQFTWILALAVSLWTNFMGMTDGKEPLVIYTIVCWVVAILWVISTVLIGRFGLNGLEFSDVYGLAGDFCYTPELSVSLVSTLLPVVLAMLATVAFLSHSCIYWSRWEDFHNMYLDSFNKTEIPLLLMFFAMVFLSGVGAYVHLYVREVYTFGIFVTLEFFQGLYTMIVYVFLSWHTLTRKHKKYGIDDEVEPLTLPGEPDYLGSSMNSLTSSTRQLNIMRRGEEERDWEGVTHPESKEGTHSDDDSSGSTTTSSSGEGAPPIPLSLRPVPSEDPNLEGDDSQLDDLMFMLKTQNLPDEDDDDTTPLFSESPRKPTTSEHLELRRISIADTHL